MTVITISRQFGSGGDEIANRVCTILGYRQFDKRLMVQTARDAGLSERDLVDYTEDDHKIHSLLDRLLGVPDSVGNASNWITDPTGSWFHPDTQWIDDTAVALMQKIILIAYQVGELVIIGRGGQAILKDQPDVLHIRIEAPTEDRIQRVKALLRQTKANASSELEILREAQEIIVERDAASRDYLRRYYKVNWDDALLYHMVLNTGKVSIEQATQMIVGLVHTMHPKAQSLPVP